MNVSLKKLVAALAHLQAQVDALRGGSGSGVLSVVAGTGITVDNTDPQHPIVNASSGSGRIAKGWRVRITFNNGGTVCEIAELGMRETSGGSNQCSGGTPFASSVLPNDGGGPYTADKAFDGLFQPPWASNGTAPQFIGYLFASAVAVNEITVGARSDVMNTSTAPSFPKDFTIQSSTDTTNGTDGTWVDEWAVSGQTAWTLNENRVFTRP